jgi:hypothetical protein
MKFEVTPKAQRPASMNGHCFYCKKPIGDTHLDDCVLIQRKVLMRVTIEYEDTAPAHWGQEKIESARNSGSWCADNLIEELERLSAKNGCLCGLAKFEYVRDVGTPECQE